MNTVNFPEIIVGFILGLVLWIVDKLIKPKLQINVSEASNLALVGGKFKILNLRIKNIRREGMGGFFNKTATLLRCRIDFLDYESKDEILENEIIARWNTTREPLTPDYKQVDVGLALTNPREVISPGDEASISVIIRKDDASSCYPFNNESYLFPNFSKPEWEIKDKKFIVRVTLQSAETQEIFNDFLIQNKANLSQFKISKKL